MICVCFRSNDPKLESSRVLGGRNGRCSRCIQPVYISPATLAATPAGTVLVCTACLSLREIEEMRTCGPQLLPGQLKEAMDFLSIRNALRGSFPLQDPRFGGRL